MHDPTEARQRTHQTARPVVSAACALGLYVALAAVTVRWLVGLHVEPLLAWLAVAAATIAVGASIHRCLTVGSGSATPTVGSPPADDEARRHGSAAAPKVFPMLAAQLDRGDVIVTETGDVTVQGIGRYRGLVSVLGSDGDLGRSILYLDDDLVCRRDVATSEFIGGLLIGVEVVPARAVQVGNVIATDFGQHITVAAVTPERDGEILVYEADGTAHPYAGGQSVRRNVRHSLGPIPTID